MRLPFTPLVETLPSSVPFVGPEALERRTGDTFPRPHRRERERVRAFAPRHRRHRDGGTGGLAVLRSREP